MKNILNQKIVFFTFFFIKFFLQLFSLRNFFNFSSELLDAPYSFNFFVYNKFKERSSFKNTHPYVIKSFASKNFSKKEYLNLCFFYKNFLQISYKFGDYPYLYASPKFSKKMYFKLLSRLYSTKWIFNRKKKKLFFSKSNEAKFYLKYIDKIDFYKAIGFVKKYNYLIYKNIRYINTPFLISYLNYETYYLHPLVSRWTWGRKRWKKKKNLKKLKNKLYRLRFEKRQKKNFLKKFSSKKNFPLLKNYFILRKLFSSNDLKFLKDFDYLDKLVHYKYGLKKKKNVNILNLLNKVFFLKDKKKILNRLFFLTFKKKKNNYYFTLINFYGEVFSFYSSGRLLRFPLFKRTKKNRNSYYYFRFIIKKMSIFLKKKKIFTINYLLKPTSLEHFNVKKIINNFSFNKIKILRVLSIPKLSHGSFFKHKKIRRL